MGSIQEQPPVITGEQQENQTEMMARAFKERFKVDINNTQEVLDKITSMGGKMPDVADMSNMYREYQRAKEEEGKSREAIH